MSAACTFDLRSFQEGLRAKLAVTKRTGAEVLNQAAGSILANAIRGTNRANRAAVRQALTSDGLALRLVQSRSFQGRLPRKLQGFTRGTHTKAEINAAARRLVAQRVSSCGYVAAGWYKALQAFRPASKGKVSDKGKAGQGRGTRATPGRLEAVFENHATGANTVGAAPLQEAIDREGRSMKEYGERMLASALK